MIHSINSTVPNVVFKTRVRDESVEGPNPYRWQDVSTDEIFKGKSGFGSAKYRCLQKALLPPRVGILRKGRRPHTERLVCHSVRFNNSNYLHSR